MTRTKRNPKTLRPERIAGFAVLAAVVLAASTVQVTPAAPGAGAEKASGKKPRPVQ